jgi:hypothetical protein
MALLTVNGVSDGDWGAEAPTLVHEGQNHGCRFTIALETVNAKMSRTLYALAPSVDLKNRWLKELGLAVATGAAGGEADVGTHALEQLPGFYSDGRVDGAGAGPFGGPLGHSAAANAAAAARSGMAMKARALRSSHNEPLSPCR